MNKNKSFFSYVIPSVIAFALSGVYAIADGFFIGNSLGDIGLSAINIAYPIGAFMQAVGTGIGMGGAVNYSIYSASGDKEKADSYAGGTGTILLIASVVLTAFLYIGLEPILILLGAEGDLLAFSKDYLRIIVLGAVFQIFSTGIVPLIRNYNGAAFAMASMTAGFSTNILLDYIFVWVLKWGVSGAAIATIIGQSVTMITGLAYLLVKKRPVFCFGITKVGSMFLQIVKVGLAPFGLTVTPNLSVILMDGQKVHKERLRELLHVLKLEDKTQSFPHQLSGGQQQRAAIGRALLYAPALILADEPTGNLDTKNSQEVIELLRHSNRKYKQTLLLITHDEEIALQSDRVIRLEDGSVVEDRRLRG